MKKEIAEKNDRLRSTFIGCKVVLTSGVAHSPDVETILSKVRTFNHFTPDNDPHGERDFGSFDINGAKYFWKFDYFDEAYACFEESGRRVLTIMRADEY